MSFVPAPQKANAAGNAAQNALTFSAAKGASASKEAAAASSVAAEEVPDEELIFKIRTYDVYWVDKESLMYKDGYAKVRLVRFNSFKVMDEYSRWMGIVV